MDPHVLRAAIQEMIDLLNNSRGPSVDDGIADAIGVGERALLQGIVLGEKK
jgi:hypothetical protein